MAGTAPGKSTFDGNPNVTPPVTAPYRPGSADFNGIGMADHPTMPPDPSTMPTAALFNTYSAMCVAFGRMIDIAIVSVAYATGSPYVLSATGAPSNVTPSTFTIARTSGGSAAGDITITWAAGTFPALQTQPTVSLNGISFGTPCISTVTNGVRVITYNTAATPTDMPFTFRLN